MKKRRRYEDYGSLGELNTTSLLDLAFILLIVFIVALPLLVVHPPPPAEPAATTTPEPGPADQTVDTPPQFDLHVLAMAADRTLRWDNSPVDPAELTGILAGFQSSATPVGLKIELDPGLGAQDTADLMDFIRPHAITNIIVTTTP